MLGRRPKGLQNAGRTESLAKQHGLEGLWPRRNLGRGCCSPSRAPGSQHPPTGHDRTGPRAGLQGRAAGQGRAGLLRGDLLSWPLFPHKVMFLPPGEICRNRESWVCRVSARGRDALSRQALWGALWGQAGLGAAGPPGRGAGLGSWVEAVWPLCPGAQKVLSLKASPRGRGWASTQQGFYPKQPS